MFDKKKSECFHKRSRPHIALRMILSLHYFVINVEIAAFVTGIVCTLLGPSFPLLGSNICFPLSCPGDVTTDESGRVYVGLEFYGRVQVYDSNGEYLYGFFVDTAGKFRLRVEPDGSLTIAIARGHSILVYDTKGHLLSSQQNAKRAYDEFVNTQPLVHVDTRGRRYLIREFLNPEIVREDASGNISLCIRTPLWLWPLLGPVPCFLILMIVVLSQRLFRWLLADPVPSTCERSEDQ